MPRPTSLTRALVVAAAIEIADESGVDAITIRAVADRAGCSPMSLYHHVTDREDLLVAMLDSVAAGLPVDSAAPTPRDRFLDRLLGMHDHLASRPWMLHLLSRGELFPPSAMAVNDALIGELLELGHPPATAIHRFGMAWQFLLGELLDRHPQLTGPRPTQREHALLGLDVTRFPAYSHVLAALDPLDAPMTCSIEVSLPIVVDAICAR